MVDILDNCAITAYVFQLSPINIYFYTNIQYKKINL